MFLRDRVVLLTFPFHESGDVHWILYPTEYHGEFRVVCQTRAVIRIQLLHDKTTTQWAI